MSINLKPYQPNLSRLYRRMLSRHRWRLKPIVLLCALLVCCYIALLPKFASLSSIASFSLNSKPCPPTSSTNSDSGLCESVNKDDEAISCKPMPWMSSPSWIEAVESPFRPNVVHYIWKEGKNGKSKYFNFANYLTVKTAIAAFTPDMVYFHYPRGGAPKEDKFRYHRWFELLKDTVPNMVTKEGSIRNITGGLVLPVDAKALFLRKHASIAKNFDTACIPIDQFQANLKSGSSPVCVNLGNMALHPRNFIEVNFSKIIPQEIVNYVRLLLYGKAELPGLKPNPACLIPLVAHYAFLGDGQADYLFFMSILSALFVLKVDAVLVHGDTPGGPHWLWLVKNYPGRVVHIPRQKQEAVFGRSLSGIPATISDVWRLEILYQIGGAYMDFDAVWTRPFDTQLRSYDAAMSLDWVGESFIGEWPDSANLGVFVAKPGSEFVRRLYDGFLNDFTFLTGGWHCYICLKGYRTYERFPWTVRLERRLQVISYHVQGLYHPPWVNDYKSNLFNDTWNWREAYAVHWTWPNPPELSNEQNFMSAAASNSTTVAAQVGRQVIKNSGIELPLFDRQ